jgi:hypothetical protein
MTFEKILIFIWTHLLVSILAVGITYYAAKAFWTEHEQHALAEQSLKTAQTTIAGLQSNIAAVNAQASSGRARLERALASVKTPQQAAAAIPQVPLLTNVPLNMRPVPDNPVQVSVDAVALYTELNTCAQQKVTLDACQQNVTDLQQIDAQKDVQIKVLKKKPSFLSRVKHVAEAVGVGIVIGVVASHGL